MTRELTLSVIALACAGAAHAQLGRTQDWNTFGADIGRTGMERTDPFLNKESVAKQFSLLYKIKLEENARGQLSVTPPVIISILISYRGFKELAFSGSSNNVVSAINVDAGKMFWQKPLIYSSEIPQVKDPAQACSGSLVPAVSLVPTPPFARFRTRPRRGGSGARTGAPSGGPRARTRRQRIRRLRVRCWCWPATAACTGSTAPMATITAGRPRASCRPTRSPPC